MMERRACVRVVVRWRDGGGGGGVVTGILRGLDRARNLLLLDCRWEEAGGAASASAADEGADEDGRGAKRPRRERAREGESDEGAGEGAGAAGAAGDVQLAPAVLLRGEHVFSVSLATT